MKKTAFILIIYLLVACKNDDNERVSLKPGWIDLAFESVQQASFNRIKAVAWWHENWEEEDGELIQLRIDSSPESLTMFQQAVADEFFVNTAEFVNNKLIPPAQGVYFSAFPDFGGPEDVVTSQRITDFENLAQKNITWAYFSDNWYQNIQFPADAVQTIHQSGRVPFIRMMARTSLEENIADPNYSMQNIIDGQFDNDLLQWFTEASQTGFPLLIEFGTEVNGEWFPWNGIHNGGATTTAYGNPNKADGPERFVDAYRHIINLSRQAGAMNITWFFHIDADGQPAETWNDFENYYPGDDYIDWIGVSVYGALSQKDDYETFANKLNYVYPRIIQMSNKPIAVLEMGVVEYWIQK